MIGKLPQSLMISGKEYKIRSDYRIALLIFQALNDAELKDSEKRFIMIDALYEDFENMSQDIYTEAFEKASEFLDGGSNSKVNDKKETNVKTLDWEQDEQIIFSAINRVASREVRADDYVHWWTFLGYFYEIGECLLANVMSIRHKKATGKKLSKAEEQYYKDNKDMIDIAIKRSDEELNQIRKEKEFLLKLMS